MIKSMKDVDLLLKQGIVAIVTSSRGRWSRKDIWYEDGSYFVYESNYICEDITPTKISQSSVRLYVWSHRRFINHSLLQEKE